MAHAHQRVTADEQLLIDAATGALSELLTKVMKASVTPEVIAKWGFRYTGFDGKSRKWKLELRNGTRTLVSEGTVYFGVSTYLGTTKAIEDAP